MADRRKGLRLIVDTQAQGASFRVTSNPEAKLENLNTRTQKVDRESQLPMWTTDVLVQTSNGGQVISVTTLGHEKPAVSVGEMVDLVELEALPWTNTDKSGQVRNGVAFRATALRAMVAA